MLMTWGPVGDQMTTVLKKIKKYIYLKSNVYTHTSSVDCTQYGLYNLKQYDHYTILNDLIYITLLYTINICAE